MGEIGPAARPRITRRRGACDRCRLKKVRCNGDSPCSHCNRISATCRYTPTEITTRPRQPQSGLQKGLSSKNGTTEPGATDTNQENNQWYLDMHPIQSDTAASDLEFEDGEFSMKPMILPTTSEHQTDWSLIEALDIFVAPGKAVTSLELCPITPQVTPQGESSKSPNLPASSPPYLASQSDNHIFEVDWLRQFEFINEQWLAPDWRDRFHAVLFPASHTQHGKPPKSRDTLLINKFLRISRSGATNQRSMVQIVADLLSQDNFISLPAAWGREFRSQSPTCGNFNSVPFDQLRKLISSCFEDPLGVVLFLDLHDTLQCVDRLEITQRDELLSVTPERLIISILAAWGTALDEAQPSRAICDRFAFVLQMEAMISGESHNLAGFFAAVVFLLFCFNLSLSCFPRALATAVSAVQSLGLHREETLRSLCVNEAHVIRVKRACWLISCIDKVYALRWDTFSIFPGAAILYDVPKLLDRDCKTRCGDSIFGSYDWLIILCDYASICKDICCCTLMDNAYRSSTSLDQWYSALPDEVQLTSKSSHKTSFTRRAALYLLFLYYEAKLAIYDISTEDIDESGLMACTTVAVPAVPLLRDIVLSMNSIENTVHDRALLYVPVMALCRLLAEFGKESTTCSKEALTLFAMVHGLFGRLSSMLPTEWLFDRVTEGIDLVRA